MAPLSTKDYVFIGIGGAGLAWLVSSMMKPRAEGAELPDLIPSILQASSKVVEAYTAGVPSTINVVKVIGGKYLRGDAASSFMQMYNAAKAVGVTLQMNSGFRSMAEQTILYAKYKAGGALAAQPGHSNHQGGIAADIESGGGRNAAYHWLVLNAGRYGWRRTVASEPWHWVYAGRVMQLNANGFTIS